MTTTTIRNTTTTTTSTSTGTMTSRRGKLSTATSVLLLCAALLLTKSWGAMAFSALVNPEVDVAQADPWIDTTIISEGSGWDTTTEQITESPTEVDTTTEVPETTEISTDVATETTIAPAEETTAAPAVETTTSIPLTDLPETTSISGNSPDEDTTSVATEDVNNLSSSTTTVAITTPIPSEVSTDITTTISSSTTEVITTTPVPTFECQAAGVFSHISGDCSRYHNCLLNAQLGQLQLVEAICPELTIFSPTNGRCVRDLSTCQSDSFQCPAVGRFGGSDDTYYYNCVASLSGGFHKFLVRCSTGQRFEPMIGGCWRYDWTQLTPGQEALESSDLAAIKRELKQYKAEDKLRKKAQKNLEKLARQQQKNEEKLAKKAAKEEAKRIAKAEKEKAKQQGKSLESAESIEA